MDKKSKPILQAEELVKNLKELMEEIESGKHSLDITTQKTPHVHITDISLNKEEEKS